MAGKAEMDPGINPGKREEQVRKRLTHEDLIKILGPDYKELVFAPLKWLNVVERLEDLDFQFETTRHERANGQKSDAHYIIDGQKIGKHRIYAYLLETESRDNSQSARTSEHMHWREGREVVEHYFTLKGAMYLLLDNPDEDSAKVIELQSGIRPHVMIPPRTYHQGEVINGYVFQLVVMPDTADIPDEELHIPR